MKYIIMILLLAGNLGEQNKKASATCDAVTTNVDGTPCIDLSGYKVHMGMASRSYNIKIVDIGLQTSVTINEPFEFDKRYYFAITAYDLNGNESGYSNEQSLIWPKPDTITPAAPPNFILILIDGTATIIQGETKK